MHVDLVVRDEVIRRHYGDGHDHRITCPSCSAHRRRGSQHEPCMSVRTENGKILYHCWHCDLKGIAPMNDGSPSHPGAPIEPILQAPSDRPITMGPLTDRQADFLASRGIKKSTAQAMGVFGGIAWVRDKSTGKGNDVSAIGFPYCMDSNSPPYAAKYRAVAHKGFIQKGAAQTFWNLERITDKSFLVITEGELDALSVYQASTPNVVSVPTGAPSPSSVRPDGKLDPREDGRFGYIFRARAFLDGCPKIIIATDRDAPGDALAEELARRIGKHKCWRVKFPDAPDGTPCKDANDVLTKLGPEALDLCVRNPSPWPVNGLYAADHFFPVLDTLYEEGASKGASTGFKQLDEIYTVAPGQVTVVTGIPSSGKSEFIDQLMVNLAQNLEWRLAICSFENEPRFHLVKLLQKYIGKPFFRGKTTRMTPGEYEIGKGWVKDHFTFLYQADGSMADIDSIIERIRVAVMRNGIRGAVIDPYNFIEKTGDVNETEFVSAMLTKLKLFAQAHDIHIWIIAHPAKMYRTEGGKIPIPTGYDISGSGHWFNKSDCGITVHRNLDEGLTEVHAWKIRFQWVGKRGMQTLAYDPISTRYVIDDPIPFDDHQYIPRSYDEKPPMLDEDDPSFRVTPRV